MTSEEQHQHQEARRSLVQRTVYQPLRRGSAVADTVARLGQAIGMGLLQPGDRLPRETQLAADFGISAVTLRAALSILRGAGVLETQRGRGARTLVCSRSIDADLVGVRPDVSEAELRDIVDYRCIIEGGAAALAATRATDEMLDQIEAACAALDGVTAYLTWAQRDTVMHLMIADASGSARLVREVADLRVQLYRLGQAIPVPPRVLVLSNREHRDLVRALRTRQPERARLAMVRHVSSTGGMIAGLGRVRQGT